MIVYIFMNEKVVNSVMIIITLEIIITITKNIRSIMGVTN